MLRALAIMLTCLLMAGCGGRGAGPVVDADGTAAPSMDELQAVLEAEFARLGIDPARATAAAPQGGQNAVFDLSAEVIDPDGEGGEPPTGIQLSWTEQLVGDYDQNGLVDYSDLTPIGQQWQEQVTYDHPTLHGGFELWPEGDPDDDGSSSPPAEGSGALNWRRARIDGHSDELIEIGDITPIAQHWEERLSGYRVYVKEPAQAGFAVQDVATAVRDNLVPVRYSFAVPVDAAGLYSMYVAGDDDESGTEGPPSAVVYVDVDTGSVNYGPVAKLSVEPGFAGAPAEITLDATASYDVDGSIAAYEWDFDGDGVIDWVSTDPVPETSSGGTVESITPGADGIVTAKYTQGSAEWLYPSVVAVDDQDAESAAASVKLGISGWVTTVLNPSMEEAVIRYYPSQLAVDPQNGDIVLAATQNIPELHGGESLRGLWFMRETESGLWIEETVPLPDGYDEHSLIVVRDIVWSENLLPLILFTCRASNRTRAYAAHRQGNGTWVNTLVWDTSQPEHAGSGGSYVSEVEQWEPGRFAVLIGEWPTDKEDLYSGLNWHFRSYVAFYEQGAWSVEYTGYDSAETLNSISCIQGLGREELYGYFRVFGDMVGGVWRAEWEDGAGFISPQRMDDVSLTFPSPHTYCREAITAADGSAFTVWESQVSPGSETWWLIDIGSGGLSATEMSEISHHESLRPSEVLGLYGNDAGYGMFVLLSQSVPSVEHTWEHWRIEGTRWIRERVQQPMWDSPYDPSVRDAELDLDGEPVVLANFSVGIEEATGFDNVRLISERLDPRVD